MNTRGLVELIVLNLGLSSGILNTKTFSVMVIMCLFTTFTTCPIVSFIYPESMRIKVSDLVKAEEEHHLLGSSPEEEGLELISTSNNAMNVDVIINATNLRLAVVIDSLENLPDSIKFLSKVIPHTLDSKLSVTALRFIEPTLSRRDELLPPTESGRIIKVDELYTDFSTALKYIHDPSVPKPELLPLTVFCQAMDTAINAFRIQGNPDDFSSELKLLSNTNDCSLILMPWRQSAYLKRFFWASVHNCTIPIALIVESSHIPHVETDVVNNPDIRGRSNSTFADVENGQRERSNTLFSAIPNHDNEPHLYTTDQIEVVHAKRRSTVTSKIAKVDANGKNITNAAAIITGLPCEIAVLSLLFRLAEAPTTIVNVYIPRDVSEFKSNILNALDIFKSAVKGFRNVFINEISVTTPLNYEEIFQSVKKYPFDIFICGFIIEPKLNNHHQDSVVDANNRNRSHTISDLIGAVVPPFAHADNNLNDFRPDQFIDSALKYPELGVLGNLFVDEYQRDNNGTDIPKRTLIVLHETRFSTLKRTSVLSDGTTVSINLEDASQQLELEEPDEKEKDIV